ncbi:MAG: hypothetical protein WCG62_05015 [Actinomycetes bacterium]
MEFAQDDVMTLPYFDRKLIVVERDAAVEAVRRAASENAESKPGLRVSNFAPLPQGRGVAGATGVAALGVAALGVVGAGAAAIYLWKARQRSDNANLPILVVATTQAESLSFPSGHPVQKVVYVADPGVAGNYYPVARFHRYLFDHKLAEALRFLRSLAATEISIEYIEGFTQSANIDFSLSPPASGGGEIGGGVDRVRNAGAKITQDLRPTAPAHIPKDLIWYREEALWQDLADARLNSGLREFTIDVRYSDDFGINAKLGAKINSVGYEIGGKFTECQETVWKLSGKFADVVTAPNVPI